MHRGETWGKEEGAAQGAQGRLTEELAAKLTEKSAQQICKQMSPPSHPLRSGAFPHSLLCVSTRLPVCVCLRLWHVFYVRNLAPLPMQYGALVSYKILPLYPPGSNWFVG